MHATIAIVVATTLLERASAHFSFADISSQILCDASAKDGINWLPKPIMEGQPYAEWWMHGQVDCQSKAKGSFALPANNRTHIVMSSRFEKVPPPYGTGRYEPSNPDYVLTREEWGVDFDDPGNTLRGHHNIHAYTRDDTSGCALAIAYKNKAKDVLPEDFVIFSVVHDCPKRQREPIDVPNLPECPNGNCICAWFWIPKNSGAKNFYMTPFVCHVTGADADASPVDVEYAIPPRRCLDPTNCNFGPRQPAYWGGTGDHINMPEVTLQSPNYSILYGFREGAQNDIFVNSNPRRHVAVEIPTVERCNGKASQIVEPASWTDLTSPTCRCTAKLQANGKIKIFEGQTLVSTVHIDGNSGPRDLFKNASFKACGRYFPLGEGPYRMDLNDKCYLYLTDAKGVVVWESMFDSGHQVKHVVGTFTGMSPDPLEWPVDGTIYSQSAASVDGTIYSQPPTASATSTPTAPSPTSSATSLRRGRRRRPTQKPTYLPTYWPSFSPTLNHEAQQPTAEPMALMRRRRTRSPISELF